MNIRIFRAVSLLAGLGAGAILAARRGLHSAEVSVDETGAEPAPEKFQWMRIAKLFIVFMALLAAGGFLTATSGIIPIKASSGHWPITRWFLQFSKERSVSTHSLNIAVPSLDDESLILKGATHYEIGCRPCHGSPEMKYPRVAQAMMPPPPYLSEPTADWNNKEYFHIIKHGLKFTGMPAWPSQQRDDEVWAMVAFMRRFPDLDAAAYSRLARGEMAAETEGVPLEGLTGPAATPRAVLENCARCHRLDGGGRGTGAGAIPRLAGQHAEYLADSLHAYANGQRHSGIMQTVAAPLTAEEIQELSQYYAGLPSLPPPARPAESAIERGRVIATQGLPEQRVPACIQCHGHDAVPRNPHYPDLNGQSAGYLALQLQLFKQQQRGGTEYAPIMHHVARELRPEQMQDVARYFESLAPAKDRK